MVKDHALRMSLRPQNDLKPPSLAHKAVDSTEAPAKETLEWANLTETEKSAASLGVDPDAWKPIAFLNTAHHETLLKANALDEDLAKKLEAYKAVSAGSA